MGDPDALHLVGAAIGPLVAVIGTGVLVAIITQADSAAQLDIHG